MFRRAKLWVQAKLNSQSIHSLQPELTPVIQPVDPKPPPRLPDGRWGETEPEEDPQPAKFRVWDR